MPASTIITPQILQEIAYSVHDERLNDKNPKILDREALPLLSFMNSRKKEMSFTGGIVIVKLLKDGGLKLDFVDGYESVEFQQNEVDVEMRFEPFRCHMGIEFWHATLEDEGYTVEPNAKRGKNFAVKIPKAEVDRMIDIFKAKLDDYDNAWDERLDYNLHLDGSASPKNPVGLDGLLPLDNLSGSLGGQPRTDPLFQHYVKTGLTVGAGGNLERELRKMMRATHLRNRGYRTKLDAILVGADFLDGYVDFARANGMPYERSGGTGAVSKVDIGLPDTAIHFNGIPMVHNPTFEILDANGENGGVEWTKRAYFLSSKTFTFGCQKGKDKKVSVPADQYDLRLTRMSMDGRYVPLITKASANAVMVLS